MIPFAPKAGRRGDESLPPQAVSAIAIGRARVKKALWVRLIFLVIIKKPFTRLFFMMRASAAFYPTQEFVI